MKQHIALAVAIVTGASIGSGGVALSRLRASMSETSTVQLQTSYESVAAEQQQPVARESDASADESPQQTYGGAMDMDAAPQAEASPAAPEEPLSSEELPSLDQPALSSYSEPSEDGTPEPLPTYAFPSPSYAPGNAPLAPVGTPPQPSDAKLGNGWKPVERGSPVRRDEEPEQGDMPIAEPLPSMQQNEPVPVQSPAPVVSMPAVPPTVPAVSAPQHAAPSTGSTDSGAQEELSFLQQLLPWNWFSGSSPKPSVPADADAGHASAPEVPESSGGQWALGKIFTLSYWLGNGELWVPESQPDATGGALPLPSGGVTLSPGGGGGSGGGQNVSSSAGQCLSFDGRACNRTDNTCIKTDQSPKKCMAIGCQGSPCNGREPGLTVTQQWKDDKTVIVIVVNNSTSNVSGYFVREYVLDLNTFPRDLEFAELFIAEDFHPQLQCEESIGSISCPVLYKLEPAKAHTIILTFKAKPDSSCGSFAMRATVQERVQGSGREFTTDGAVTVSPNICRPASCAFQTPPGMHVITPGQDISFNIFVEHHGAVPDPWEAGKEYLEFTPPQGPAEKIFLTKPVSRGNEFGTLRTFNTYNAPLPEGKYSVYARMMDRDGTQLADCGGSKYFTVLGSGASSAVSSASSSQALSKSSSDSGNAASIAASSQVPEPVDYGLSIDGKIGEGSASHPAYAITVNIVRSAPKTPSVFHRVRVSGVIVDGFGVKEVAMQDPKDSCVFGPKNGNTVFECDLFISDRYKIIINGNVQPGVCGNIMLGCGVASAKFTVTPEESENYKDNNTHEIKGSLLCTSP